MRYLILFVGLVLTGCSTTLYHPNYSEAKFTRDLYDCEREGWQHTSDLGFDGNPFIASEAKMECMLKKHGYSTKPVLATPSVPREPSSEDGL